MGHLHTTIKTTAKGGPNPDAGCALISTVETARLDEDVSLIIDVCSAINLGMDRTTVEEQTDRDLLIKAEIMVGTTRIGGTNMNVTTIIIPRQIRNRGLTKQ